MRIVFLAGLGGDAYEYRDLKIMSRIQSQHTHVLLIIIMLSRHGYRVDLRTLEGLKWPGLQGSRLYLELMYL